MEPICRDVIEPMQDIIENLIALPARCKKSTKSKINAYRNRRGKAATETADGSPSDNGSTTESSCCEDTTNGQVTDTSRETKDRFLQKDTKNTVSEPPDRRNAGRIYEIPIGRILSEGHEIRRSFEDPQLPSLADSIRRNGVLTPIVVRTQTPGIAYGDERAYFSLICGTRRLLAASAIGAPSVPCIVLESEDLRAEALSILENLQTERLGIFDAAASIAALGDLGIMTREQIACVLSLSKSAVANKQRLLHLNAQERTLIQSAALTERHARAFLRIKDARQRLEAVRLTAKMQWNVASTEAYIDTLPHPAAIPAEQAGEARGDGCADTRKERTAVRQNPRRKCVLRDLDAFFGTIDRSVAVLREAGIPTENERREEADGIRISLFIPTDGSAVSDNVCPSENVSRETPLPAEQTTGVTEP